VGTYDLSLPHADVFMSWDIFVQDLPAGIASVADIPHDFVPSPIGLRSDVIARVSALYPECSFAKPSWGVLDIPGCSIELNLGTAEELMSFAMHVRGDERASTVVAHILGELGMRALDPSSRTGLFEQDAILRSESFARWRSYRSSVLEIRSRPN
jgi:hypothetical protein